MKRKEISKILALTLTATLILNPYLAHANDEISTVASEISSEANTSDITEAMNDFLKAGEGYTSYESNNDYNESVLNGDTSTFALSDNSIYLSDIDYIVEQSNVGWGDIQKDQNVDKGTIRLKVNGQVKSFAKGLGAHANSTLVYDISEYSSEYTRLSAYLGVDYSKLGLGNGVRFTIYTSQDGETWKTEKESEVLTGGSDCLYVDINVQGVKYIKLYADINGNDTSDHAIYADARLIKTDYDISNDVYTGFKTLEKYDEIISSCSVEENYKNNKKLVLEREFVNRIGYDIIQTGAVSNYKIENALDWLLNDEEALQMFIEAGTLTHGSSVKTLKALGDLYDTYKNDLNDEEKGHVYKKMLIATSVSYCKEISTFVTQYGGGYDQSDPVKKFTAMKKLYDAGKFPYQDQFDNFPMELVRTVMDARMDDTEIEWLRYYTEYKIPDNVDKRINAYNFVEYLSPNYGDAELYSAENKEKWEDKYKLSEFGMTSYGKEGRPRLWMVMEKGGICWGISGMGINISEVHGIPAVNIYQPGHEAYLVYTQDENGIGKWTIWNNVFSWAESYTSWGGNTLTEARMLLGWGMKSYSNPYKNNGSYMILAQAALNDYDNYLESMFYTLIGNSYKAGSSQRIEAYDKALECQKLNLDSYDGLIEAYKAANKSEEEWLELARRVIDSYTYYPLAMVEALDRITHNITNDLMKAEINILKTNALYRASVVTEQELLQSDVARSVAKSLLGTNAVNLASFSFSGENANKIVLDESYSNTNLKVRYSLDGGKSWRQNESHTIELSNDEIASITTENDILVGLVGTNATYTIDILAGKSVSDSTIYNNDLENLLIGDTDNLEYSLDNGQTWNDYVGGLENGIRFEGDTVVKIRYKAHGVYLQGNVKEYTFTANTDSETRKYVQLKNITLDSFSSQHNNDSHAASNMIDGNANTGWHTTFNVFDQEKYYTVKLDKVRHITSIEYLPNDNSGGANGRLKDAYVYTSLNGVDWVKSGSVTNLANNGDLKTINLNEPTATKYIKIVGVNTYGNYSSETNMYMSGKMINLYEDTTKKVIEAGLNKSKGGIMLSTAGLGLRFFTSIENVDPKEVATYYITTASNDNVDPKFEVKSSIVGRDYSQIKTSIEFSELSKLEDGVDTKLYLKRVKNGQKATYIELTAGDVDLSDAFDISNSRTSISVTKDDNGVIKLNKTTINEDSFKQGLSKISWNSTGMVIEGTPELNGDSSVFENTKVSMLLKDSSGNYIQESGKNIEVRGIYIDGKYKVTIPYNLLNNVKEFELRLIGENVQNYNVLTKGDLSEFESTIHNAKKYTLSADINGEINLTISEVDKLSSELSSELSSVQVSTNSITGIQQFSIKGNLLGEGVGNINSKVRYTLIAKKGDSSIFEQVITRVKDSKGSYNGFKGNISLNTLLDAQLAQGDEISLILKVENFGEVKELDLYSDEDSVEISGFEIKSKDGKAVLVKK